DRILNAARTSAQVTFENDLLYRQWVARHGGVYVPITGHTPPNPYLQVPERDVTTTTGRALTLVNPAYMARQANQMSAGIRGNRGHLTSLRPTNPENAPDDWERAALESFERGVTEARGLEQVGGEEHVRFMRPFITERPCLKCHAAQGYREGDIRGGISVAVATAPLRAMERPVVQEMWLAHLALWAVGLGGIGLATRGLGRQVRARARAEEALRHANEQLEHKVEERTSELAQRARQLRALAGELTLVEQRERRRMATLLHDHLQQLLVGARLRAAILGRRCEPPVSEALAEIDRLLDEAITASRSLTAQLSPPILHEGGLEAGLQWLGRWMADRHGLTVELCPEEGPLPLTEDVKILLFESVRELLFNAVKHARVHTAQVSLQRTDGNRLQITVSDSGCGFDPASLVPADRVHGGFGLFSIRERLDLIGGGLEVRSAPGQGSRFVLTAPLGEGAQVAARAAPDRPAASRRPPLAALGPGRRVRVVLADDHVVMREGLARLLEGEPDMEVVGQASDGQMAVELARRFRPDVVLMDLSMPAVGGIDATRAIHQEMPQVRVIGLSMFEEPERAQPMLAAGAVAFLAKSGPAHSIMATIRAWSSAPCPPEPSGVTSA
ncbi:MAG: response regulator, partial [Candidatus Latescibacterota bacterium]